jgi:hypothetical protein
MHKKLSDTATEADWSFLEIPFLADALRREAEVVAVKFHLDSDDVYQEALLDMAVRPGSVASAQAEGRDAVKLLAYRANVIMVDRAKSQSKHDNHSDYAPDDLWWDGNES